jgi:two-component system, OmpR family, sensor histidine kinase MprB
MTLRLRLTIVVAAVVAGAVIAVAGVAHFIAAGELRARTDTLLLGRLQAFTEDASGTATSDEFGEAPSGAPALLVELDVVTQTLAADGTVDQTIEGQPHLPVSAADRALAAAPGEPRFRDITVAGVRYRLLTGSITGGGAVQIARPLTETQDVLSVLRNRLVVVALAGTVLAGLVAWAVVRRATRPIVRLTGAAEHVAATQDLTVPLPVHGSGRDEVGRLTASFDTMLNALAASKEQQNRLVLDASHELRTPLTAVRANIDFLQRADRLDAAQRRHVLSETKLELAELTDLVGELVEMATEVRTDEPVVDIELGNLVTRVADRYRRRSGRVISSTVKHPGVVAARRSMLERAVSNLVDNALKFSPPDTAVELVLDGTRIAVLDRGVGLASADRDRIFDRFYRADATRTMPGSGLGLSIVKQIVDIHGGTVQVDERDDGGAVATIVLPGPDGRADRASG